MGDLARSAVDAASKSHIRYLEDITREVDGFGLEHVEAIECHPDLDAMNAATFRDTADVETVAEAFREYWRVDGETQDDE